MNGWHADQEQLARFATAPETLDELTAASLEAHLLDCDACRRTVTAAVDPLVAAASWDAIADRIDQPRRAVAERVLARFVTDHVARVVGATPALRLSWLAGVVAVVAAAVMTARQTGTDTPFLALAPLIPLAGVAAAFGPGPDPAGETALATPLFGAGLLLYRAAAVLATSLVVLAAGSLALPGLELRAIGWVLPALGLTFAALALCTWLSPFPAIAVAAVGWLVTLQSVAVGASSLRGVADSALFDAAGQTAFAALTVLAAVMVANRRQHLRPLDIR
jgi:hypothetical protein